MLAIPEVLENDDGAKLFKIQKRNCLLEKFGKDRLRSKDARSGKGALHDNIGLSCLFTSALSINPIFSVSWWVSAVISSIGFVGFVYLCTSRRW